jgi:HTH-type transcriptional regulator / antitoxin HigA
MINTSQNDYESDYVTPAGETLLETLEAVGMSQIELAVRMDRPYKTINEIIRNKASITAETALQLEQVLDIPASFWLKREQRYREFLARLAEKQRLNNWVEWLKDIPIQLMMRRGWIPASTEKSQQVLDALKFFAVASPAAWQALWESKEVAYRKSTTLKSNFGAIATWLRQGELEAREIECAPYKADAFRDALLGVRALTRESVDFFQKELVNLCAQAGVAVVFVQELPYTGISGATQWLTSTKALVQLSLRYKTDDQLWFAFFHEAGHILLHGKRAVFLEIDDKDREQEEQEADAFASDTLIHPTEWQQFTAQHSYHSKAGIEDFARKVGVAPGIVVGRLQHGKLLPYHHCNQLKRRIQWDTEAADVCY